MKRKANGVKRSKRTKSDGAPEGFTKVEGARIAGFWVPEIAGQSLRGIVGDMITKQGPDGKPNVYCHLTLTSDEIGGQVIGQDPDSKRKRKVEVGSGMVVGVGGAVLLSRLRGREGREVFIRFEGLGPKMPGKSQARLYDVYEREGRS
jgi:hypothetical protein